MTKAIVTGASGFVGTALVKNLVQHGYDVTVVVRNEHSNIKGLNLPSSKVVISDLKSLLDLPKRLNDEHFDVFFHLAWDGVTGDGRYNTTLQMTNIQSTLDAVEAAKALGCTRFIGAGSIMEDESLELSESLGKPMPMQYLYGAAKLSAHLLSKTKAHDLGIDHVWPKITNTYGPGEISPRFINTTLRKILNGEKLEFTAGTQNYDFVYIDDVVEAFRLIAEKGKNNTTYVIGSGHAQALRNYVESLHQTTQTSLKLNFGDIPYMGVNLGLEYFDPHTLVVDTGFSPSVDFVEGIQRTYEWIKGVHHAKV